MKKRNKKDLKKLPKAGKKALRKITGTLSTASGGFGFVNTEDGTELFIPPSAMNGALDGDTVEAVISDRFDPHGPSGKITAILHRKRKFLVCQMTGTGTAQPLNHNIPIELRISGSAKGAKRGDWVNLRLLENGSKFTERLRASMEEKIGPSGSVYHDLLAVSREFDLPPSYSPELERAASALSPCDMPERRDLTDLFSITIDPEDAKDFDDAVSIENFSKTEWRIGVHIADVAAYVKPGTKFDKEARKRGFSSYIPGMFRPMLPHSLTKKISLNQGVRSLAHTVFLRVSKKDGSVLSAERFFSTIEIKARLNYREVQESFDGSVPENWNQVLRRNIASLRKAASLMRAYRKKTEVFLELETDDFHISCDEDFRITGMEKRIQSEADRLVEECMLAANSAVAMELSLKPAAGIYRIHPEPLPEKLEEFSLFVSSILKRMPGDLSNREVCNQFLRSLPEDHRKGVIISSFLRSMPRASYSPDPGLHFGLGKTRYSHFTSPIRRYSDLALHQQLHALAAKSRMRAKKSMGEISAECSRLEQRNDEAYFSAVDRLKLHWLKSLNALESHTLYEAAVVKFSSQGMICDIPAYGLRGFVPARFLHSRSKHKPRPGDFIYLYLESLDFAKGRAIFRPTL